MGEPWIGAKRSCPLILRRFWLSWRRTTLLKGGCHADMDHRAPEMGRQRAGGDPRRGIPTPSNRVAATKVQAASARSVLQSKEAVFGLAQPLRCEKSQCARLLRPELPFSAISTVILSYQAYLGLKVEETDLLARYTNTFKPSGCNESPGG